MSNTPIWVTRSSMPTLEEYTNEIASLWDTHMLTNMGAKHHQLEEELEKYLGVDDIALFVNGHNALECVIEAMGLKGKVITTPAPAGPVCVWRRAADGSVQGEPASATPAAIPLVMDPDPAVRMAVARRLLSVHGRTPPPSPAAPEAPW